MGASASTQQDVENTLTNAGYSSDKVADIINEIKKYNLTSEQVTERYLSREQIAENRVKKYADLVDRVCPEQFIRD